MRHVLILSLLIFFFSCANKDPERNLLEGKPIPSFNLILPDSTPYIYKSNESEKKPTVLFLFSPRCPYCRTQITDILSDMDMLKDFQFFFITNFPLKEMKDLYVKYNLSKYKNIITGWDSSLYLSSYFDANVVPYFAIYGKTQKLNKILIGKVRSKQIKKIALL